MIYVDGRLVATGVIMPFGKHYGEDVADLPLGYVTWLLTEVDIWSQELKNALDEVYHHHTGNWFYEPELFTFPNQTPPDDDDIW